ncbi:MAG: A/G-specific adenine glycosylase [Proteobacteria bacterium]|nr:A/G-specific adenine glycosylase [Pseudomonadota bacterium]
MKTVDFQTKLIDWYDKYGRKDLPWQVADSYSVWISEIMLQQAQVISVIDYFKKFIARFPTLNCLAKADLDDVLGCWSGLGYYNRARNIHKTAQICADNNKGILPNRLDELMALPGIGRTTAGAILSLSQDLPFPILDGNVKRVVSRVFTIRSNKLTDLTKKPWHQVEVLMPEKHARKHNQALMDLGSIVCRKSKPNCQQCPLIDECKAFNTNQIKFYPQKNKKTKQQEETLHVLLSTQMKKNSKQVFLQKRDHKSIWPGLWFLPIFPTNTELSNTISAQHGKMIDVFSVRHILTHRKLTIKVTVVQFSSMDSIQFAKGQGQWQDIENIRNLPYPAALKKIIEF